MDKFEPLSAGKEHDRNESLSDIGTNISPIP